MGKIYSTPEEVGNVPQISSFMKEGKFDSAGLKEAEEEWEEKLRAWCKEHGSSECAGEVISEPVADGCALYMVLSIKPVALIHVGFGDAYQFRWAHRWTASDIKSMIKMKKEFQAMW